MQEGSARISVLYLKDTKQRIEFQSRWCCEWKIISTIHIQRICEVALDSIFLQINQENILHWRIEKAWGKNYPMVSW